MHGGVRLYGRPCLAAVPPVIHTVLHPALNHILSHHRLISWNHMPGILEHHCCQRLVMFPETNNWLHSAITVTCGSSMLRQLQLHIAGKLGVRQIRLMETSCSRVPVCITILQELA